MMKPFFTSLVFIGLTIFSFGQNIQLNKVVTISYANVKLGDVLQDISNSHDVRFSYSRHYVPIDKRVSVRVEQKTLSYALDRLFEETDVVYANIGDQIVLKRSKKSKKNEPIIGMHDFPARAIEQEDAGTLTASNRPILEEVTALEKYNLDWLEVISEKPEVAFNPDQYFVEYIEPQQNVKRAQITLIPEFGTNMDDATDRTNNFSLNVLGGENGGVDGVEVGGLFNKVTNDVNGIQLAGLFNHVGGDVGPSRMIDGNKRKTFGVQVAGLVNTAHDARAIQVCGLVNADRGNFRGVQFAGIGNSVGLDAVGVQFGGFFNVNGGDGEIQLAGITNIADDVNGAQISGIFNKAREVEGFQIGLINVNDTISGPSIGLINLSRRGYNQIEIGGSETMHAQLALRFGSHKFYNILQFGAQFNEVNDYSFGYGIGVNVPMKNNRWQWNPELLGSYIVEDKERRPLSLLFQFRLTAEYKISTRASFYFGPTANIYFGRLYKNEIEAGKELEFPLYTLFDNLNDHNTQVDTKIWFGFRAGMRFGRN